MADETRELATFVAKLTYEQIPTNVRERAAELLVDQIGVEIGCSELPWAKQVRDTFRKSGGAPEATVLRYGDRLPAAAAAFINSTFGHSFEYDDGNPLAHGHIGAELIPPLLAIAERDHMSGRDFLTALIAGYEVRGRLGWAVSPDMSQRGGPQFSTGCGPFGVAAGAGKLLKLDTEGICNAMGIAGAYSGGLVQYDHGGGSVKRIYTAVAASSGMQAAHLAQAGLTGPEGILEGARGALKLYSATFRPERLVADFGKLWTIEKILFKSYCVVAIIHSSIDGLRKLIAVHKLTVGDIDTIDVGYPSSHHDHVAITAPHDLLGMQFSTSYSLAITLLKGRNTPHEYTAETLADPQVREVASRIHVREDVELNKLRDGGRLPARVAVRMRSGEVYEQLITDAKGSPGTPLSADEINEKFGSQVATVFGSAKSDKLLHTLRHVEELDDMAKLPSMLVIKEK